MDYSTALCDRHGRIVAQGLTLAVQLGTFPTGCATCSPSTADGAAGRRLPRQRPVRLRRPAPARHLHDQAGLRRRRARGLGCDDGAPLATSAASRPAASPSTRPRSTRRGSDPALEACTTRGVEDGRCCACSRPTRASRSQVLGDLRAQLAACRVGERGLTALRRALRRRRASLHGRAAAVAERTMRAELAALPDGVRTFTDFIDGVGEDRSRSRSASPSRSRATRRSIDSRARRRRSRRASTAPSAWSTRPATARSAASRAPRSRTARATWRRSASSRRAGTVVNPVLRPRAARAA